jgi:hypothetical protein
VDREFVFDEIYSKQATDVRDTTAGRLCQTLPRAIISNYVREYTNLEFLNLGRVSPSMGGGQRERLGRREVFLVEVKVRGEPGPQVQVLRVQKWGVRERLDQGKSLQQAFIETDDYTEYILDRRLGCRQLGMNLPEAFTMHRVQECYAGEQRQYHGVYYQVTYFARAYVRGLASDKITDPELMQPGYAVALAGLLGRAAATNIIVGRATGASPPAVIFDCGDEIIVKDPASGLPVDFVVGDHSSTFNDYTSPLLAHIRAYATPVRKRLAQVPEADRTAFRETYVNAFATEFARIQTDYANRRTAFDQLFAWARYDPEGSFAYRWEQVLKRLRETELPGLVAELRQAIAR